MELNCVEFADTIVDLVKMEVERLKIRPHLLVILVGDDPASQVYVNNKKKRCEQAGIKSTTVVFPADISQKDVIHMIEQANKDTGVHGILVQFPVPDHLCQDSIINAIAPEKDVDGLHPHNQAQLMNDLHPRLEPCTPRGVLRLLHGLYGSLEGLDCCVVGRSRLFGKPMAQMLLNKNATVTQCHSRTKRLKAKTHRQDVVILAVGRAKMFDYDYFKHNATIIDVGINRDENGKLCGDLDPSQLFHKNKYTPVPKGIGVITTAVLMENVLIAFKIQNNLI